MLPGLRASNGAPICTACAGFEPSYLCSRCGEEGRLHPGRLCSRCRLTDELTALLDDGNGQINPGLLPLFHSLMGMESADTGLIWIHRDYVQDMLRGLAQGHIPLTHEALHQMPRPQATAHLRDLLMACGLLPHKDKHICLLEQWLVHHLADISNPAHRKIIHRFATWEILPKLRTRASTKPLNPNSRRRAGAHIILATRFLSWLAEQNLTLGQCRQTLLDAWAVEHSPEVRNDLRTFLKWATDNRLTRHPLNLPAQRGPTAPPLSEQQRLALLGQVLTDDTAPLRTRVAAALILLYAQPVSRIVRLTTDDVINGTGQVSIRFGDPPLSVPEPVATMLLDYIATRANMHTATNPGSLWLFPGRRAGQPLRHEFLARQITRMGIPTTASRGAAMRQHIRDSPAPVVADALNYHPFTTTRIASLIGTTYSRYAPGDHTPSPRPLPKRRTDDS
jgi:hypothetical protein